MYLMGNKEKEEALLIARNAILAVIEGKEIPVFPCKEIFGEIRGVFVTLKKEEELRGCIGYPNPVYPLGEGIVLAAIAAATEDPRFIPVQTEEMGEITIEISVLTPPETLLCPPEERSSAVLVGTHGLIISGERGRGLLLPQVATEYGWGPEEFLDHTCIKAGLTPGCWKTADTDVMVFEGLVFHE